MWYNLSYNMDNGGIEMKKKIDWGEISFSVFIFIVAIGPTILGIGYWIISAISPAAKQVESSASATSITEIVASRSNEPSPAPSLNPDYDEDDADRDFQQAANAAMQAVEEGEYDGNWIDLADNYLANNADYQHFIHTSPSPSKIPTPAVIPSPVPTENPYSAEQFAMLYDGAIPQYYVVAFLIGEIPDWLTVSAHLYNGVDKRELTFDMGDDMYPNGDFEADDVELWYPSQVTIEIQYSLNDSVLADYGDIKDIELPQNSYVEFVIDNWAFDEYEDGNLHENVDAHASISFVDEDGNYIDDTYVFDPEIVIYSQS